MPPAVTALIWLHVGAALVWACCALVLILVPDRAAVARVGDACAALFAAAAMPFTGQGGWWVDMPADYMVPAVAGLALLLGTLGSQRLLGRLAALALAGFFLTLGLASVRNGGPLAIPVAAKAMLFGLSLALLPWRAAARARALLLLILLMAGAMIGIHREIPFG